MDGWDAATSRYKCRHCGRDYKWRNSLLRHRHECGGHKMYQCPVCPHRSKRRDNLAKHVLYIHNSDKS
ncbi:longitudinals lacking protein-like [Homalodisca vitripennis]|uniref:longitudinals lacking protein-like n=1 Tax=Homalodisca vitripennis TaxID=197043 RepID=UPI001EEA603B|nr:longitudinals lacking protein-like [Homalodisca vitripennis]XP_046663263.1 longitudinals lacking protein-like [Homalodisca vitripennis]